VTLLLVDWLGRGGIAQSSGSWLAEARRAGVEAVAVTRAGRELEAVTGSPPRAHPLLAHRALAATAVRTIRDRRPEVVVVQNHVVPLLERPVHAAARAVGARLVLVVHDHRLHTAAAGWGAGLRGLVRRADLVVAHSAYVAERLGRRDVAVTPLPVPLGVVPAPLPPRARAPGPLVAVHFGVVRRRYKGTATVTALARAGVPGWTFAVAGAGAPPPGPGLATVAGYIDAGVLLDLVARSDATVLPYRLATQSGSAVLAMAAGSVCVASAVGGLPEQLDGGRAGVLVPAGAGPGAWRAALAALADDDRRSALAAAARRLVWDRHERFVAFLRGEVLSGLRRGTPPRSP